MKPFYIDKEDLRHKFIDLRMTRQAIADEYGCSQAVVKNRLSAYDISLVGKRSIEYKVAHCNRPVEYYQLPEGEPVEGREIDGRLLGLTSSYTWHKCQVCGEGRWIESRWLKKNVYGGRCLSCVVKLDEHRKNRKDEQLKRYSDPEERRKTGEASKKMWASDPVRKERHAEFLRWVAINPDVCKKKSEYARGYWDDPEYGKDRREKRGKEFGERAKVMWENPDIRNKITESAKMMFSTPERKDKQVRAMRLGAQISPNRPESHLMCIFEDLYPKQWKFVGNGEVVLGGKNPDFININGKKQVAELFGTYYHSKACKGECPLLHMLERKDGYAKFGYDTLIVWQHELKNEEAVRSKIVEFYNSKFAEKV